MQRRGFFGLVGAAAVWPVVARAQQTKNIPRIGILWHEDSAAEEDELGFRPALFEEFAKLGYVQGKSAIFEERFPGDLPGRYQKFADELVALSPDVLVAISAPSALASQRATQTIPVVFLAVPDPVGAKLVANLASPGANITGLSSMAYDTAGKRMQIFHEMYPSRSRIALIYDRLVPYSVDKEISESQAAADSLGLSFTPFEIRGAEDIGEVFSEIAKRSFQAVIVGASPMFFNHRKQIAELALSYGLPTLGPNPEMAVSGLLMSYGATLMGQFRAAPAFVDKILKGQKPQNLPVQQPTLFELIINMKTAKALGLDVPLEMIARADRVIE